MTVACSCPSRSGRTMHSRGEGKEEGENDRRCKMWREPHFRECESKKRYTGLYSEQGRKSVIDGVRDSDTNKTCRAAGSLRQTERVEDSAEPSGQKPQRIAQPRAPTPDAQYSRRLSSAAAAAPCSTALLGTPSASSMSRSPAKTSEESPFRRRMH